ncbi:MAG TPA: ABC transporter ATP-binding protein [Rhodoglobus sp.]|nr:ABC transporter ATP-binding protein [Rhodoglobus sp.]
MASYQYAYVMKDLTKSYPGGREVFKGITLSFLPDVKIGVLGPNGAGKSTTIRVLLGLARPTSGSVSVLGGEPWRESTRLNAEIVYVPGDVALWPNLTGGEIIDLLTGLRGGADRRERERLIAAFDLDPRKNARTYSKGNRQKVALIAAFARPARLLILDEPTSGLDPLMERVFRDEVARVAGDGATVLLSSHLLSEVEQLCDRVTIIRGGRAVESGSLAQLLQRAATRFRVTGVPVATIAGIPGVSAVSEHDDRVEFDVAPDALPQVLTTLGAAGASSLLAAPPTLETLFLRHYATEQQR